MKKKTIKISLKKILCFILAIVVIYYGGMMVRAATTPTTDITFEDDNLYKNLKTRISSSAIISSNDETKTLSIATDSIPTITQLDLSKCSISNLSGIEKLTGLTSLNLSGNSITDISKLSSLTNLTDLDLGTNTISNINDISSLTSLTNLKLNSNRISNLDAIKTLTQLQTLDLSNNSISDAKAVQSLIRLTSLNISSNSSLANLSDVLMSQLTVLNVSDTAITDITGIDNYTKLKELNLSYNSIVSLAPLFVKEEEKTDDEYLCKLKGITNLNVSYTTRTGFSFSNLKGIKSLETLSAEGLDLTSVSGIVDLENLKYLNLNNNRLSNIDNFRVKTSDEVKLLKATQIQLANNGIEDISVLGSLPNIDYLNLEGNKIKDISAIERFTFQPSRLNLRNQTIEMPIYKKSNNENHYIILYDIMQSAKDPESIAYYENATFTTEGVTLNEDSTYTVAPFYNVIITPDKTDDDTLTITLNGGVADGTKITFTISTSSSAIETLMFEDPNLDKAIYDYLSTHLSNNIYIARAPYIINITRSEIRNTKELDLSSHSIQNLKGLSNFSELTNLNISGNEVSDDSEIAYLTKLQTLNFANNKLDNHYTSIEKLEVLANLDLSGNNIKDLNSLNNYLTNLTANRKTSKLTSLAVANNQISDIQILEGFSTLQTLNISNNEIDDISYISNNTSMNNLNISGNNIEDISVLSGLRSLKTLTMSNNIIQNITPIANLSLTTLDFSGNLIEDITALQYQGTLETLTMDDNKISDVASVEDLLTVYGTSVKRQKIVKLLEDNAEDTVTIELPAIFKSAKDSGSKVYTATDFTLENCTLSDDGNSIEINTQELGDKVARVTIVGGSADATTFSVVDGLKAEITYSPAKENGKTKENVVATISFNRNAEILNNDGKNTYTFTKNGDFKFIYQDEYGLSGEMTATVDWIDNQGPQATVSYSIEEITNQDVEVTITTDEKINNQVEGWEFTDANQTAMKKTYSTNTEEKVNIQDELGNNTEVTVSVKNIDKAPPAIEGVTDGQTYDQSVTPNITDDNLDTVTLTRDGTPVSNYTSGQAITVNGEYVLTARDKAGNETSIEFTIAKTQLDDTITSSEYTVDAEGSRIDRISHDTTLSTFKNNISTEIGYKVTDKSGNEIKDTDLIGTGYKLTTDNGKEYTLIVTGDLNNDGKVTAIDLSNIRKMSLGLLELETEYEKAADIDSNGTVNLIDLSRVRKMSLGLQ